MCEGLRINESVSADCPYRIPGTNGAIRLDLFRHPADVDLWSGGVSERPLPGSMLGPTFACIIATQFSYSRRGDRFWYELPNQPSSFTLGKRTFPIGDHDPIQGRDRRSWDKCNARKLCSQTGPLSLSSFCP